MSPLVPHETALLVVDVQRGFTTLCPEELPVPGGLEIIPNVNRLLDCPWLRIDATQDWHPPNHCSFKGQRLDLYPPHCIQNTPGADFLPGLHTERFSVIWRKGYHPNFEAYAVTAQHPELSTFYFAASVETVLVCGLATNICCFFAARDLRRMNFKVAIVEDASAGLDVPAAGLLQAKTKEEGIELGIKYVTTQAVLDAIQE